MLDTFIRLVTILDLDLMKITYMGNAFIVTSTEAVIYTSIETT